MCASIIDKNSLITLSSVRMPWLNIMRSSAARYNAVQHSDRTFITQCVSIFFQIRGSNNSHLYFLFNCLWTNSSRPLPSCFYQCISQQCMCVCVCAQFVCLSVWKQLQLLFFIFLNSAKKYVRQACQQQNVQGWMSRPQPLQFTPVISWLSTSTKSSECHLRQSKGQRGFARMAYYWGPVALCRLEAN